MRVASKGVRRISAKNLIVNDISFHSPHNPSQKSNILSYARRPQINCRPVLHRRLLVARDLHEPPLPELVPGELRAALREVSDRGRTEAGEERGGALFRDELARAGYEAVPLERRIDLYACFDDVDG